MSETAPIPVKNRKPRILILILTVLAILFVFLAYGTGIMGLPVLILTHYQSKDCDSALTLGKVYTSLYPKVIEDAALLAPLQECDAYLVAASRMEQENWSEAYDAFQAYASQYPNGLFASEAHQQSAAALLSLVQDQIAQENYEGALASLKLMIAGYSNTSVITDAWNLFPSLYTPWGVGLRDSGDFEASEQVLEEFRIWSLTNQKGDWAMEAQRELAQTYLKWGLDLQSQTQFEDAIAKFELAVSVDPTSQFDSAAKVQAGQSSAYVGWGNTLLEDAQFASAIEKFELAASKSAGKKDDGAVDALANGQIRWAQNLSAEEDFQGALEHLASAKDAAVSETMQKSVDAALQDTYLAFSESTGSQARLAMREALETVCKHQDVPELPIFGLNKDSVRFGIYGVEKSLPEDLAAKTPGEMHYIACIKTDNKTVETRLHKNIVLQWGRAQFYTLVEQFRVQVIWDVSLLQADAAKSVAEETFKGTQPPPFAENAGNYFYGAAPLDELTLWLQSIIE